MADNPLLNQPLPTEAETNTAFEQAFTPDAPRAPAEANAPLDAPSDSPVNVINPEGTLVSIPASQLHDAINSGYQPASSEQVSKFAKQQKYGTIGQELATGAEGAASAATFGLSTGLERALGVPAEDIQNRRDVNPGVHAVGQVGGLLSSALIPGVGAANLLEQAGAKAAGAVGLGAAESTLAKIGSGAVKAAVDNGLFQSGDEVSKMISGDPNQTVETAMADVGLASLLGAGVGGSIAGANPLWQATVGQKVGGLLKAISDRVGGIEGTVPNAVTDTINAAGIDIAPEVKASLSSDPTVQHMFQTLQESSTGSGLKAQQALKDFRTNAGNEIVKTLGKTPEEVDSLAHMSDYDAGQQLKTALKEQLKAQIDPISEQFEGIKSRFKDVPLSNEMKADIADKIAASAAEKGYNLSASAPGTKIVNDVMEEIQGLKTLEDLRKYQSIVAEKTTDKQLWGLGKDLRTIFRGAEDTALDRTLGEQAPELLQKHAEARGAYKDAMNTVDTLNDRLRVGRFNGPQSFLKALNDMAPEDVLRRLSPKGDAGIIGELTEKFPAVAKSLQDYHLSQLLKNASFRAGPDETINVKNLFTQLDKMSPEMKKFILPEQADAKISAIKELMDKVPSKMNTSGTAKTLDSLWEYIPASAAGIATMLLGHNPATGLLIGAATKILGRDVPDAVRLGMLKFLGSSQPIEAQGFKSMVQMIQHTIDGESATSKGVKNIFKAGREVLPQAFMPKESDRNKLDKALKAAKVNPQALLDVGGKTGHYMPEAAQAMGEMTTRAVNYLNALRPNTDKRSPLDPDMPANPVAQARYNNALDIANKPLSVLSKVKDGTVTLEDLKSVKTMYPSLYRSLQQKMTDEVATSVQKGNSIPYETKMGLSLFMGQALDSTFSPQVIMGNQAVFKSPSGQSAEGGQPGQKNGRSLKSLDKISNQYMTVQQAREQKALNKS